MNQEVSYLYNTLKKLSRTSVIQRLEQGKGLYLEGTKKGFFGDENIIILIQNAEDKEQGCFKATTTINNNKSICKVTFSDLEIKLRELSLLNKDLDSKLKKIKESYSILKVKFSDGSESYAFVDVVAFAYKTHISQSFPEFEKTVKVITEERTIFFCLDKGFEDPDFLDFFKNGILLRAAVNNCKKFGVEKLVFIDVNKKEFIDYTIADLEKTDLYEG